MIVDYIGDDDLPGDGTTTQLGLPHRDLPGLPDPDARMLPGSGSEPAPGPGDDEGSALARAAALRFPDLRGHSGRERVDALIDHINDTAIARGDLEELRLEAHLQLREARAELARVVTGITKNRAAIDEAKRLARPDLAMRIDDAEWTVARCTEQINRLGGSDYDAASRTYTMLAG